MVHFSSSGCVIKTADGKTIATARREARLFKLNLKTSWSFEEERQRSDGLRGPPTKRATTSRSLERAGGDVATSQESSKAPPVPNLDADDEVAYGIDCDAALACYEDDNWTLVTYRRHKKKAKAVVRLRAFGKLGAAGEEECWRK